MKLKSRILLFTLGCLWLEKGKAYRDDAADFVGRFYYNQKPALLQWALTKPITRVMYNNLCPRKADFDLVRDLMIETGVLDRKIEFEEYTDTRFADKASIKTSWKYEIGTANANSCGFSGRFNAAIHRTIDAYSPGIQPQA